MSRLFWYPTLSVVAAVCAEPILQFGFAGLSESCARLALAVAALVADPLP